MFFTDEELKVAEEMAWQMLDGWNHAYMPDINDYAYFYYKNHMIMDPWMNEKGQELPWPDHESKNCAVDPVSYYGQATIENYLVRLFLLRPDWHREITNRILQHIDDKGRLIRCSTTMPIETYIAMTDEQAEQEHGYVCIENCLPDSKRIYFEITKLPKELVKICSDGWIKEIQFSKRNSKKVFELLYPENRDFDYKRLINRVKGNTVRIIGYGD